MSAKRSGLRRASTIVPLAVLSAAWTASLAGVGVTSTTPVASSPQPPSTLPDGTSVPTEAIEAPASVSSPGSLGAGVPGGQAAQVADGASVSGIPDAALAAYQRAQTVINQADQACNISWQLIAAVGRVESDHGRTNANRLDADGVSQPGIYGVPLDGKGGTRKISDTDAGQFDNNEVYDRAVGPMQFIPSTWSTVGVDADGDGQRNPQDIDDAALGTAVYLCSGSSDLSTEKGKRTAVYRYNHSQQYVDLVLAIEQAYLNGNFSSVPNYTTSASQFEPLPAYPSASAPPPLSQFAASNGGGGGGATQPPPSTSPIPGSGGGSGGSGDSGGSGGSGGGDGGAPDTPQQPDNPGGQLAEAGKQLADGVKKTTDGVKKGVEDTTEKVTDGVQEAAPEPVKKVLSAAEARTLCNQKLTAGLSDIPLLNVVPESTTQACAQQIQGKTRSAALDLLPSLVGNLLDKLP